VGSRGNQGAHGGAGRKGKNIKGGYNIKIDETKSDKTIESVEEEDLY
jgi:hypothetical protein